MCRPLLLGLLLPRLLFPIQLWIRLLRSLLLGILLLRLLLVRLFLPTEDQTFPTTPTPAAADTQVPGSSLANADKGKEISDGAIVSPLSDEEGYTDANGYSNKWSDYDATILKEAGCDKPEVSQQEGFLKQLAVDLCTSERRMLFRILLRRLRDIRSGELKALRLFDDLRKFFK
ncbi:hypothetical protein OROMI_028330 [Orobanche minor]